MTVPVRVGVLGAGFFGGLLADACAGHPDFEVVAVADHDRDAAARLASRVGAAVADGLRALAGDPGLDLVLVATPNHTHADAATELLMAGKDVFVEKPLTIDGDSARSLVALAAQQDRVLVVGHVMRAMPGVKRLQAEVAEGRIGTPTEAYAVRARFHHAPEHPADWWKTDPGRSGGELLHEVHELDLLLWILGEPEQVSGVSREHLFETTLTFPGGAVAHHLLSTASHHPEWQLRVSGTTGSLVADFRTAQVSHWVDGRVVDTWPVLADPDANASLLAAADAVQGHHTAASTTPVWMADAVRCELDEVAAAVRREPSVLTAAADLAVVVATRAHQSAQVPS